MASLLLELFSEEIPARMQLAAEKHLAESLQKKLKEVGFDGLELTRYSTPRRLAVRIDGLPVAQPDVSKEIKGPKVGAPEQAMQGFLKKCGMTQDQLEERDGIYFAVLEQKGRSTAEVVREGIEDIIQSFPWPKSMRWSDGETAWVRPLHSILCMLDQDVIPVQFAGITAGNTTQGHRFMASGEITISAPAEYEGALEKAHVIADRQKRKAKILEAANTLAKSLGCEPLKDEGLLEEVTGLVEYPVLLAGTIDDSFMDLPPEVLISEMRAHQKYFALHKADGSLANQFLITANINTDDEGKAIIHGNERVLRARFADARFFWDLDRKTKLKDMAKGLEKVTYHAKLGSVADKVARVEKLAKELTQYVKADKEKVQRAAGLCKADLVSGMVGEFPELQGVMGRYYAQVQGEPQEIADAIAEHYKPQGPTDSVPTAPVSVCVALADKLDTLVSMFAIGEKPTGSKDPFALRRAALGVIKITLENNIRIPLSMVFDNAPLHTIALRRAYDKLVKQTEVKLHNANIKNGKVGKYLTVNSSATEDIPDDAAERIGSELLSFFHDRLIVQLKDEGIRHDVIKAVVTSGDDDLLRISQRAKALQAFLENENGQNLLAGYKRAANILAIEEKKDKTTYDSDKLNAAALQQEEEMRLSQSLEQSMARLAELQEKEQFTEMMDEFSGLRAPIDSFFDKVMVNCEDKTLRAERLRLLSRIKHTMDTAADFSKVEG